MSATSWTVWTARVVPLEHPTDRWSSSDFTLAREKPWKIPVLIAHQAALRVGCLYLVRERGGWVEADFTLDDPEAEELMRVGQHVSVGGRQMKSVDLRWMNELSIVERGAVRGAEVISRREIRSSTPSPSPRAATPVAVAGEVTYGGPLLVRRNTGHVTAIGGRAVRTRQGHPIRYVGDDILVDLPDGRQDVYVGREGRAEAIRNGVLVGR